MIEPDTVRLLRECDAGIKMGIAAIDEVLPHIHAKSLVQLLNDCKRKHSSLQEELQIQLDRFRDEGKEPSPVAKGMSWIKTNVMLGLEESDATVSDLMTDGCNMGVKSLSRYLNQYAAADEASKGIAKRLIRLEAELSDELRAYL